MSTHSSSASISASNATPNSANAAPTSSSGTTSLNAASEQPAAKSYASATKKQPTGPVIASSSPAVAVGSSQTGQQYGISASRSPLNGQGNAPSAPPIVHSTPIANGAAAQTDHSRKPSVTITSSQGYPNGGSAASGNRASIQFGSMASGGSPAIVNSVPHNTQNTSLPAPQVNPRVISPANSPSPIPQPVSASGGRPPSLGNQPSSLNFGTTPGDPNEQGMRAVSMPHGPAGNLAAQAQHLRRESSQSGHSDMSAGMSRQFSAGAGRGRGYQQNFAPGMASSPGTTFRQLPPQHQHQSRNTQNMSPFQAQANPMRHQGSPFMPNASPNMRAAIPHPSPHLVNGAPMQYGGYPQHLQPGMYGMPQPFDPQYAQFYSQQPYMHAGMPPYPGAPPSPRPQFNNPHAPQPPYAPGQYAPPHNAQAMNRTASQGSERPPSTLNQPPTPSIPTTSTHASHPSSGSPVPATPSAQFTKPKSKSKAIVIKNAAGEVVNFDKNSASASTSTAQQSAAAAAAVAAAAAAPTPTPPPKSVTPQKADKDASSHKTKEEIQAEFREKALRAQKGVEEPTTEVTTTKDESKADAKTEPVADTAAVDAQDKATSGETEAERKKREDDEELERMIAEMEAKEKEEEEREKAFQEKKAREKAEKQKLEEEAKLKEDDELKRQEREAEAREEAREKLRQGGDTQAESADSKSAFAALAKPRFGPGATEGEGDAASTSTPVSAAPSPAVPQQAFPPTPKTSGKPKPAHLKLETNKPVEPAQPTAGMLALKSARFLQISEEVKYPMLNGVPIQSPNPARNASAKGRGQQYDKSFLLQFQDVFKEKPSPDWDIKVKETVGDGSLDSARPQSARTPSGIGRQASRGGLGMPPGPMGNFAGAPPGRTLPPGTSSEMRFAKSMGPPMGLPGQMGSFPGRPGAFGSGTGLARNPSQSNFQPARLDASRTGSSRRGGSKKANPREEAEKAAKMPLTAGQDLKPLEMSNTGWKATSLASGPAGQGSAPNGRMGPELVQRKVKSALNKMTPEKFQKISDDILAIAAQSKDETDGRTLRQVIQLTFEKACDEAHWSSMYAQFCKRMLETMSIEIKDENVKDKHGNPVLGGGLFRKYLLNRCQEEFERGWEVNLPEQPEGQSGEAVMLSDEYYIAAAAKRRGLGLIQFIGELFKLNMLTARIMHECVIKLLNFEGTPDEAAIESLVKLIRTIGYTMEQHEAADPEGRKLTNVYFDRIDKIMENPELNSRLKFMLMDVVDLRKNGWRSKDDQKGPKTITQIHQEAQQAAAQAEAERMRTQQRGPGGRPPVGRGDVRSFSGGGMGPPPDFNRNQVNIEDLKKVTGRGPAGRTAGGGPGFGPHSLLSGSRSSSGRKGLGPGSGRPGDDSGISSRTATPPAEKKEPSTSANAFSALASLGGDDNTEDVASPPSNPSSPPVAKTLPIGNEAQSRSKSPLGQKSGDAGAGQP